MVSNTYNSHIQIYIGRVVDGVITNGDSDLLSVGMDTFTHNEFIDYFNSTQLNVVELYHFYLTLKNLYHFNIIECYEILENLKTFDYESLLDCLENISIERFGFSLYNRYEIFKLEYPQYISESNGDSLFL